jgi:protein-tyrosine phosphatase
LEDEVKRWRLAGVDVVVSLLTSEEISELNLAAEAAICNAQGIRFIPFPIADRGVPPSRLAAAKLISDLEQLLIQGKNTVIHCRQGIGRAALVAACVLVLSGIQPEDAFQKVGACRGQSVPETLEQKRWVGEFARGLPGLFAASPAGRKRP